MTSGLTPSRRSSLAGDHPGERRLLFGDLHNHTLFSDGRGDACDAFRQLARAGLDVAALTDHTSIPLDRLPLLSLEDYPTPEALACGQYAPRSIDAAGWERTAEIADSFDRPGEFTALRGFEWTEPWLGHVNVWFSDDLSRVTSPGRLDGLYDFLSEAGEALFGINHPGRESGRMNGFEVPVRQVGLTPRMVSLEIFNRTQDFLFEGCGGGQRSALADCLDAGWRPALIGCSDEHSPSYGLVGKGRTGLWAPSHSRDGVREALLSRHTYATRQVDLRLDATLDGVPMGSAVRPGTTATLHVDCEAASHPDTPVEYQLLTSGVIPSPDGGIRVVHRGRVLLGEVTVATVPIPHDARWLILRIADPALPRGCPAPVGHRARGWALAYASPWYLDQ
jgi:hypothetical protein